MRHLHRSVTLALPLLALAGSVLADPFCGDLTGTLPLAGSPHLATCDLRVPPGETLDVEAGVTLRFTAGTTMTVQGSLNLNGALGSPVVFESDAGAPAPSDWVGLDVQGTATLRHAVIRHAEDVSVTGTLDARDARIEQGFQGVTALSGSSVDLADSVFADNVNQGLRVFDATTLTTVDACDFSGGSIPIVLEVDAQATLSNLTASGHFWNGVVIDNLTDWSISPTWTEAGLPYILPNSLRFVPGTTLTLEPGVIVKIIDGGIATFELDELVAVGTDLEPIVITSLLDDTAGGDTNADGASTTPDIGDWNRLLLTGTGQLENVTVRHGEDLGVQGSVTVTDCRIENTLQGITAESGSTLQVTGSTFADNANQGLRVFDSTVLTTIDGCDFTGSGAPVILEVDGQATLSNLTATGNFWNGVVVDNLTDWSISPTWTEAGLPYVLPSSLRFVPGTMLTLQPGVVVKVLDGSVASFELDGLVAVGTPVEPIVLTSLRDDTGGDTNGDGASTTPDVGDWNRLVLTGTGQLENVTVRHAEDLSIQGSVTFTDCRLENTLQGITAESASSLQVTGSTFADNVNQGLRVFDSTVLTTVDSCDFSDNGVPVILEVDAQATLSNLTASGHFWNGIVVDNLTDWSISPTWTEAGLPYVLPNSIRFIPGTTLTLQPGVVVKLIDGSTASLELDGLIAVGTALEPIVITSLLDDTVGGDTNGDGGATTADALDWLALTLTGMADLDEVTVRHGRSVQVEGDVTIDDCRFERILQGLIAGTGSSLEVAGTSFTDNGDQGLLVRADTTLTSVDDCDFTGSTVPVFLDANSEATLTNLTASGNRFDAIFLAAGSWSNDTTLTEPGLAYTTGGAIDFNSGNTLTLLPGVVLKTEPEPTLQHRFDGFQALGTAERPVVFTSFWDDSVGGDSTGDGDATSPAAGDWGGLLLRTTSDHLLSHVELRHATDAVTFDGATARVEDSRFVHSLQGHVWQGGSTGVVVRSLFHDLETGVHVDDSSLPDLGNRADATPDNEGENVFSCNLLHVRNENPMTVPAESCWWGSVPPAPELIVGSVDQDPHQGIRERPGVFDLRLELESRADVRARWMPAMTVECSYRAFRSERPDGGFVDVFGPLDDAELVDPDVAPEPSYYYLVIVD
ncbi:MAG: right-handed parallel beta-helix repeat-containing protein [Acidobacteriota bacterium]